jgi:hypothetical protein
LRRHWLSGDLDNAIQPTHTCDRHNAGNHRKFDPRSARIHHERQVIVGVKEQLRDGEVCPLGLLREKHVDVLGSITRLRMPVWKSRDTNAHRFAALAESHGSPAPLRLVNLGVGLALGLNAMDELHELSCTAKVTEKVVALDGVFGGIATNGKKLPDARVKKIANETVRLVGGRPRRP